MDSGQVAIQMVQEQATARESPRSLTERVTRLKDQMADLAPPVA